MTTKVLLIEDDPLVAMMLEGYLDVLGHEIVASAASVADALTYVAEGNFDFAILDVHLANGKTSEAVAAALGAAGKKIHSYERGRDSHGCRIRGLPGRPEAFHGS